MKMPHNEGVLIDFKAGYNPSTLSDGSSCYFQNKDGSHSSENVSEQNI